MKVLKSRSSLILLLAMLAIGSWFWVSRKNEQAADPPTATPAPARNKPTSSADSNSAHQTPTSDQGNISETGKFEPLSQAPPPGIPSAEAMQKLAAPHLQETAPGEFTIGRVRLDRNKRSIEFPATVAEREQLLEYALVHENGKIHEALFKTSVPVRDLHVAALLLDAVGQSPTITVRWPKHGGEANVKLSELIEIEAGEDPKLLSDHEWRYNGSEFHQGGFAAMREGSLIALMNDPAALINHPAAGARLRDDIFSPRPELLPPAGIEVTIQFTFPDPP